MQNVKQSSLSQAKTIELLLSTDLFKDVTPAILSDLASELELVSLVGGEILMRQGEPNKGMYIIITGRLQAVATSPDGQERVVNEVGRGESVGEMGLISGRESSVALRAVRDTQLVRLSKAGFERLIHKAPEVLLQISRVVVDRLRKNTPGYQTRSTLKTIAVIPAGKNAPMAAFVERLVEVLSDLGSVLLLNRQNIEHTLPEKTKSDDMDLWGESNSRMTGWLNEQESKYRFIVYQSDLEPSAWSQRCLRQADRILLVAQASSSPELNEVEAMLYDDNSVVAQTELVLLQQEINQLLTGTHNWLAERSVLRHHHIHLPTRAHVERVVRFLTGRAVGLVLGGGGARGAAHIGVVRALLEAGVPIDIIGGTSAGALVAAEHAMGCESDEMHEINLKFAHMSPLKKYTFPIVAFVGEPALSELSEAMFGQRQIEDLWVKNFSVSCNISTGQPFVHEHGPLGKAMRATTSVPGMATPVVEGQHLLVDGGLLDNLPLDIMKERCDGPIIAVNVSPDKDLVLEQELSKIPSGWKILWSWINPFKKSIKVPTIAAIMGRVATMNHVHKIQNVENTADFYLKLPLGQFGMMDFTAMEQLAEMGYHYTRDQIKKWKEDPSLAEKLWGPRELINSAPSRQSKEIS